MPVVVRGVRFLALCIFLRFAAAESLQAQSAQETIRQLESASPSRAYVNFDGAWQYSRNGGDWTTLAIPSSLDIQGKYILQKAFSLTAQQLAQYTWNFVCLGSNYQCDLYVNGQFVTHHVGAYTGWNAVIPANILREGENTLRIEGSNELSAGETSPISGGEFAPKNYGGVFGDVALIGLPVVRLDDIRVQIANENESQADVQIQCTINAGKFTRGTLPDSALGGESPSRVPVIARVEIYETGSSTPIVTTQDVPAAIAESRSQTVRLSASIAHPHLWSCSAPFLYKARCVVSTNGALLDERTIYFGIRQFTAVGGAFVLNGAPCEIKGVVYEEDRKNLNTAFALAACEQDLQLIKTLGANAIRTDHPASPLLIRACDENGVLLFEQLPTHYVPSPVVNSQNYISLSKNNLQAMIERDRNHPSVVAWGLGSNINAEDAAPYFEQLGAAARRLDPRPTYCTTWNWRSPPSAAVTFMFLDAFGDDAAEFQKDILAWESSHPSMPVVAADYGKTIKPDDHNGYNDPLAVESQAKYLLTCYNTLQQHHAAGGFVMSFADWHGNRPSVVNAATDPSMIHTGLLSYGRDERRLSYDVIQALYTGDTVPTIIVGEDPESAPVIYVIVGLIFLLLLVYLANNSRRFRENFNRAIFRPFNFYADIRDQRILSTFQTTILGVITSGTYAIVISSIFYYIRTNPLFDSILGILVPWDALKYQAALMIWNPVACVVVLTLVFFTVLIVLTATIRFCAIFVRPRIFFGDAYSIVLWAGLPGVILIPLSMILYRVIMLAPYVAVTAGLSAAIVFWILFRIVRGTAVVFDVPFRRVYIAAIATLLAAAAIVVYLYDSRYGALAELAMMYRQVML